MNNIGYIQFQPTLGDIEANIEKIESLLPSAEKADLVVLPELANSGYNFATREDALKCSEEISKSRFIEYLISRAAKQNQYIVAGLNERVGEELFNTSVIVGPKGYMGKYQKIHLFLNEKDIFKPGEAGLPVFDIGFGKTSMLICFDYIFPEVWRIIAMKGADIICHPSNLITTNAQKCIPAQAFMNKVFIITSNRYGTEGDITFSGKSFITNPDAEIIDVAVAENDAVSVVGIDLSLARNKFVTPRNHVFEDRIPLNYKDLI
jgi:predicted amidohydrolase